MKLMVVIFSILTFLAGLPTAWAYGRYLISVEKRRPKRAAAWDFVILVLAQLVTLNLWAIADDSIWVLVSWVLGNVLGTYLVINQQKCKDIRKNEKANLHRGSTTIR